MTIWTAGPFEYAKTFEAQRKALRDAGLPIVADFWLNVPGRYHNFPQNECYRGLPWSTGMVSHCGTHTNPWGDMKIAVENALRLADDPRATACKGFTIGNEINHRGIMIMDLFAALAWDPRRVKLEGFVRRYAERRYGTAASRKLTEATSIVAETLLSHYNMDATNAPLYRRWMPTYLPGLTPESVKRSRGWRPELCRACELLLSGASSGQSGSPMYRFDLVNLGRTYLGGIFNHHFAKARMAFRAGEGPTLARYCDACIETMRSIAMLCSADPQFRLKTWDDWAQRWPEMVPGHANSETNWIIFTALISRTHWKALLDYAAEDFAELIEHYFLPRVSRYFSEMERMLAEGKTISGRLVQRDTDMPFRVGDFAPPSGGLPWSAFGNVAEPELTVGDSSLARQIIQAGSVSGKFLFHKDPPGDLLRRLLDKHPVPPDLPELRAMEEPGFIEQKAARIAVEVGAAAFGFETLGNGYLLRYDPGSPTTFPSFSIAARE